VNQNQRDYSKEPTIADFSIDRFWFPNLENEVKSFSQQDRWCVSTSSTFSWFPILVWNLFIKIQMFWLQKNTWWMISGLWQNDFGNLTQLLQDTWYDFFSSQITPFFINLWNYFTNLPVLIDIGFKEFFCGLFKKTITSFLWIQDPFE